MHMQSKTNIANRVRNTRLPKTKPLMPLFEVISNGIHAINEAKEKGILNGEGIINIKVVRNGNTETLSQLENIDSYPVKSFEVTDNGIGLNDENLNCFAETDTDHKITIGGKGVGRFVCLKAFKMMIVSSCYVSDEGEYKVRQFELRNTKEGFHGFNEDKAVEFRKSGTKITLSGYKEDYQKHVPQPLSLLAKEIINHFQLYFIREEAPTIIIENQNNDTVNCKTFFETNMKKGIISQYFNVGENPLVLHLTKSFDAQSHKLNYCAHNRTVKEEGLASKIIDLGKYPINSNEGRFYY